MPKRRSHDNPSPAPPARRPRLSASASDSEGSDEDAPTNILDQMAKKLVRLALASEYSRQPLRRTDISAKIDTGRSFRAVFERAQTTLGRVFGMQLVELPIRDKITIAQKRAAQKGGSGSGGGQASASSNAYVLASTLPGAYRAPAILRPPPNPSVSAEAGYVGLYTFIVSIIYLNRDSRISEGRLEGFLKRCNADEYVIGEKTEKVLKRMEKEGYIIRVREKEAGGEENVDWVVGPRGKVEIGERGVAAMVKTVYGKRDAELDELEERLEKSLGVGKFPRRSRRERTEPRGEDEGNDGGEEQTPNGNGAPLPTRARGTPAPVRSSRSGNNSKSRLRTRNTRRRRGVIEDEAEEEDDDDNNNEEGKEDVEEDDDEDDDG